MDTEISEVAPLKNKILMFPWLAYGHISPYLELAKKLSDRGFFIYLCSTPVNLLSINHKITQNYSHSIQLVELHLPDLPELPPSHHTTNGLPRHLNSTLGRTLYKAKPNLSNILKTLNPHLLIYDMIMPWAAGVASRHNIPAIRYATGSAAVLSYFFHMALRPRLEFPFPAISLHEFELPKARRQLESAQKDAKDVDPEDDTDGEPKRFCDNIMLLKTSREFDGKYVDYIADLVGWKIATVCPLLRDLVDEADDNELIQWLGKKTEFSSVFVSFGSEYFLGKEEIEEIACGLELSNVNFIWVLRFPKGDTTTIEEALPKGFLERIRDRGRVVGGWAPQQKILSHPSTGGFVSHCGWNSLLESIEIGVPIIAMPMHLDQPLNARLMVETGVAVEVSRDENGKHRREETAKVIKDVVMGKTGETVRAKIKDLGEKLKASEEEDLDGVVDLLTQLCAEVVR